jgi:cytidylate kinase
MAIEDNSPSITISRQLGSLGGEIARLIADRLGYRLVLCELINQAAQRAGVPEVALASIDELGLLGFCPSPEACHAYREAVEQIMHEMVDKGKVIIIGRAGQIILRERSDVLHVRVIAPINIRIARVATRYNISPKCAQAQLAASDRFRSRYVKQFYNANWNNPELYDLLINTSHISSVDAAQIIFCTIDKRLTRQIEDTTDAKDSRLGLDGSK